MNRRGSLRHLLVVVLLGPAVAAVSASEATDLRPAWKSGEITYVEMKWDNEDKSKGTDYPAEGERLDNSVTYGFLHEVERVTSKGTVTVKLTIDRAAVKAHTTDTEFVFDTDAPSEANGLDAYGTKLRSLVGQSFHITIGRDGRIEAVEGLDPITAAAMPAEGDPNGKQVMGMYNCLLPRMEKIVWQQYYGAFAFDTVEVGDTWTRRLGEYPSPHLEYKLDRVEVTPSGRRAIVTHRGHLDRATNWQDHNGLLMRPGPYDSSGQTIIDLDHGTIVSSQEDAVQELRAQRVDDNGKPTWWFEGSSSSHHEVTVLTKAEREAAKRKKGKHKG